MKFYDKEIYNRNEKIKAVIVIIIPFLIGFIVGCFTMNMETQTKIDDLNKLIEEKENSKDINLLEDFDVESNSEYRFDLVIKINGREYILDSQEFSTENDEEIKGIYNKDDFLEIQPEGYYIILNDIDVTGSSSNTYRFGCNLYYYL